MLNKFPALTSKVAVLLVFVVLLLLGGFVLTVHSSHAANDDSTGNQFFPETGHIVSGKFLAYWQKNGGLAVFGYPITDAQNEVNPETGKTYLTQWFERSRLELHPENAGTPYEVEQGLLGVELNREALAVDPNFQRTLPRKPPLFYGTSQDFVYFPETGHNLNGYFLKYWQDHGGLAQFGYPISEAYAEPTTGGYNYAGMTVQWFERARFELHEELISRPGQPPMVSVVPSRTSSRATATSAPAQPAPTDHLQQASVTCAATAIPAPTFAAVTTTTAPALPASEIPATPTFSSVPVEQLPGQPVLLTLLGDEIKAPNRLPAATQPAFQWQLGSDPLTPFPHSDDAYAIALDSQGNIFATDSTSSYVTEYDEQGDRLAIWPISGTVAVDNPRYAPAGIALDAQDNIYVADSSDSYVYKFTHDGKLLLKWGGVGNGDGQFNAPLGITVDAQGNVYVADTGNDRLEKFDNQGHFLMKWGSRGGYDGQVIAPQALTVDNQGHVYVADTLDNLIEEFDNNGGFVRKWGGYSTDLGKFKAPIGVAFYTNPANQQDTALYTLESLSNYNDGNNRVQKFDAQGHYLLSWGGKGLADTDFSRPFGLAVDSKNGFVYVADEGTGFIKKFDLQGNFIYRFRTSDQANGELYNPYGVVTDKGNNIYVTDSGNARVQKFTQSGQFVFSIGTYGHSGKYGEFDLPISTAVDKNGNIFVADNNSSTIQKFDASGHYLLSWGSVGSDNGQFQSPVVLTQTYAPEPQFVIGGMATDSSGNVYVADTGNDRIQKFDNQGHFLAKWDLSSYYPRQAPQGSRIGVFYYPNGPTDIAIDAHNDLYVVSILNGPILKFDTNGQLLLKWNPKGPTQFKSTSALGVTVDTAGNVYVSDLFDGAIQKFDSSNGQLLTFWGQIENGAGGEYAPYRAMAIDKLNHLWLIGGQLGTVLKFTLP